MFQKTSPSSWRTALLYIFHSMSMRALEKVNSKWNKNQTISLLLQYLSSVVASAYQRHSGRRDPPPPRMQSVSPLCSRIAPLKRVKRSINLCARRPEPYGFVGWHYTNVRCVSVENTPERPKYFDAYIWGEGTDTLSTTKLKNCSINEVNDASEVFTYSGAQAHSTISWAWPKSRQSLLHYQWYMDARLTPHQCRRLTVEDLTQSAGWTPNCIEDCTWFDCIGPTWLPYCHLIDITRYRIVCCMLYAKYVMHSD